MYASNLKQSWFAQKTTADNSSEDQEKVQSWLVEVFTKANQPKTVEKINTTNSFAKLLEDGTILCELMRIYKPENMPKYRKDVGPFPFRKIENCHHFVTACKLIMPSPTVCEALDITHGDIRKVISTLLKLQRTLRTVTPVYQSGDVLTNNGLGQSMRTKIGASSVQFGKSSIDSSQVESNIKNSIAQNLGTAVAESLLPYITPDPEIDADVYESAILDRPGAPLIIDEDEDDNSDNVKQSLGGPCLNCGNYPAKHEDLGLVDPAYVRRNNFITHFGNSYKNWLISKDDIELDIKLGEGSFGEVYKAFLWGKVVAAKLNKYEITSKNGEDFKEMVREVEILATLRHPNVILFMGLNINLPDVTIVTEFMDRGDLVTTRQYLADNVDSHVFRQLLLSMLMDVCKGMSYLHVMGIIHRDLKAENIFVDRHYIAKIGDFGLSRKKGVDLNRSPNYGGEYAAGTPGYIAPEILAGDPNISKPYSTMSDVFAMGMLIWECVTGEYPFVSKYDLDSVAIANAIVDGERPVIPDSCPEKMKVILLDCWEDDPYDRPTFDEIGVGLRHIARSDSDLNRS